MSTSTSTQTAQPLPHPVPEQRWEIHQQDCFDRLAKLPAHSVDAVITDPPYGINFGGLAWDRPPRIRRPRRDAEHSTPSAGAAYQAWCERWTRECLRVLKPGGHLVSFAAPRTAHRLACALEDQGFEIRDLLLWLYGQGFPKSKNLTDQWAGWGTTLKPAYEPILLTRKPPERCIEQNLARHHTGALNIDACRFTPPESAVAAPVANGTARRANPRASATGRPSAPDVRRRWPTNLLLSHAPDCRPARCASGCPIDQLGPRARFYYCPKASRRERDAGCEQLAGRTSQTFAIGCHTENRAAAHPVANHHPTVKPLELMRWLIRLVTPPGALVLDPFAGSGSTGAAAMLEGMRFHGIERDPDYAAIAQARIAHWAAGGTPRGPRRPRGAQRRTRRQRPVAGTPGEDP